MVKGFEVKKLTTKERISKALECVYPKSKRVPTRDTPKFEVWTSYNVEGSFIFVGKNGELKHGRTVASALPIPRTLVHLLSLCDSSGNIRKAA